MNFENVHKKRPSQNIATITKSQFKKNEIEIFESSLESSFINFMRIKIINS